MFGSFSPVRKGTNLLGRERAEAPCSRAFWKLQAYEVGMPKSPLNAYKFAVNPLFSLSASLALIQRGIGRKCSLETLDLSGLARFVSDNPASSRRLPHQCQSCHLLTQNHWLWVESSTLHLGCNQCWRLVRYRHQRLAVDQPK